MNEEYLRKLHGSLGVKDDFETWVSKVKGNDKYLQGLHGHLGIKDDYNTWKQAVWTGDLKKKEPTLQQPSTTQAAQQGTPYLGSQPSGSGLIPSPATAVVRGKGLVPSFGGENSELQKAQQILSSTGIGFSGQLAQPVQGISGDGAMGRGINLSSIYATKPSSVHDFGQGTQVPVAPPRETNERYYQDQIAGLEAQKQSELAQIPESEIKTRNQIIERFDSLKKQIETKIVSEKDVQAQAKQAAFQPPAQKDQQAYDELSEIIPSGLQDEGTLRGIGAIAEKANREGLDIVTAQLDYNTNQIKKTEDLLNKDLDEWAKQLGSEVTQSDLNDIKAFQDFARETLSNSKLSKGDQVKLIDSEYKRLESKIKDSDYNKNLTQIAYVRGESVDDLTYNRKKEVANTIIENLPSDMSDQVRQDWDATSKLRDFMAQYYDPSGKTGFTIDKDGRVVINGITDKNEIDYINKTVSSLVSEYENGRKQRYAEYSDVINQEKAALVEADKKIALIEDALKKMSADDPRRNEYQRTLDKAKLAYDKVYSHVQDAESLRGNVFVTDPKKVVLGISNEISESESAQAAFNTNIEGLTPYQRFERGYMKLLDETEAMRRSGDFDASYLDQVGQSVRNWLDWENLGVSLSKEEKEYLANRKILNSLSPIFLNNNLGVTEQSGDFFEAFMSGVGSFVNKDNTSRQTQTQVVADQLNAISKQGFASEDFNNAKVVEQMEDRIEDVPWYSAESAGQITGVVAAVMADMVLSDAIVVNPAVSLSKKSKYITSLGAAYDKAIDATRLGRFLKAPIEAGVKYEVAGDVFGSAEEELNFSSGLIGTMGGDVFKMLFKKMPLDKAVSWVSSQFGANADNAIAVFKKIGDANSRGMGELAEEFSQELTQIYNDELRTRGFWDEVATRFGDFDENMKFIVSSYLMGAGFSFVGSNDAKARYNALSDDQKKVVDDVVSEVKNDVATATANVVDKSEKLQEAEKAVEATEAKPTAEEQQMPTIAEAIEVVEDPEADVEYLVDDKFYSEKEVSDMLEDPAFVESVRSGDANVKFTNPSEQVKNIISSDVVEEAKPQENVDTENKQGIPSEERGGEKPVEAKPIEKPSGEATASGGDVQASQQKEVGAQLELNFDEISDDVQAITDGKTPLEIAEEANMLDEKSQAAEPDMEPIPAGTDAQQAAVADSVGKVPEGQAPLSNTEVFNSIVDFAKEESKVSGLKGQALLDSIAEKVETITDGAITKDDFKDVEAEIKAKIPKEVKVSGKSTQKLTKEKFNMVASAMESIADKLAADMSTLKSSPLPIVQNVVSGSIKVAAKAVRATGDVAQAIEDGVKYMKESEWFKGLSTNGQVAAEKMMRGTIQQTVDTESKKDVPPPTKKPAKEKPSSGGEKDRSLPKNMSDEIREGLSADAKKYIPISNQVTVDEANAIIEAKGEDLAMEQVLDMDNKIPIRVRVVMGMRLMDIYTAKNTPEDLNKAIKIGDSLAKEATRLGQAVQAFSLLNKMTADGLIVGYNKDLDVARKKLKEKNPNLYKGSKEGYKAGTKSAGKKAANTVFGKNTPNTKKAKAFGMSKDDLAKKKADSLKKLKDALKKGGGLTSGGLNTDAIEALGEYGFYVFADGVRTFKEWAAEMKKATGITDNDALSHVWNNYKSSNGKTLNELSSVAEVEDVIAQHFVSGADNAALVEMLKKTFNLDDELAEGLANEITDEFNRIVKSEREAAINKRVTGKLTKKVRTAIDAISKGKNLSDPKIEQKIEEAFGIKDLTEEQMAEIKALANERDKRPDGFLKDEMTRELLSKFESYNGISKMDIAWSMWYASVLSGYETQILNVWSNAMNIALETMVTSIEKGPKAFADSMAGMWKGVKIGSDEFIQVLDKGFSPEKIKSKLEVKDALENVDFAGGKFNPFNYYKYVGRFMSAVDTAAYQTAQGSRKQELAAEIARKEGLSGEALKKRVSELLNNSKETYNEAYEQATKEINNINSRSASKMSEREKNRLIRLRANEIIEKNIPEEVRQPAKDFASFVTFNYDPEGVLGFVATKLAETGEKYPWFRLVVPFTRIVANVLNQQLDYTPYGFLRAAGVNLGRSTSKPTKAKDIRDRNRKIIKAMMGTLLMTGIYSLFKSYEDDDDPYFDISGQGPSDYNKKNQLYSQGWRPYSIKIGGKWISYQYTPIGLALAYMGNWIDNEKYNNLSEQDLFTKSTFSLMTLGSSAMDMSFLTGLSGLMSAMTSDSKPENQADRLLKSFGKIGTSFIPNLFKQIDKVYDPTIYESDTIYASIMKEIPIVKRMSDLKPKLNAFGQPAEKVGNRFYGNVTDDHVWLFMGKHKLFATGLSDDTKNVYGEVMSDEEFYDYAKISGEIAYKYFSENMKDVESMFEGLTQGEKQKFINKIFKMARNQAKFSIAN